MIEEVARKRTLARKRELIQIAKEKAVKHGSQVVTKLSIAFLIFAILLAFAGIMVTLNLPQQEQALQLEINLYYLGVYYYSYILHAFEPVSDVTIGTLASIRGREANIFFSMIMPGFCFFLAGLSLPAGVGLLNRRKWGWYLGLLQGISTMLIGVYPILFFGMTNYLVEASGVFVLVSPFLISMGAMIIAYLTGEVKHFFDSNSHTKSGKTETREKEFKMW